MSWHRCALKGSVTLPVVAVIAAGALFAPGCDGMHGQKTTTVAAAEDGGNSGSGTTVPRVEPETFESGVPFLAPMVGPSGWEDEPPLIAEPVVDTPKSSVEMPSAVEASSGMYDYFTSLCGVRLPMSQSLNTLEPVVGDYRSISVPGASGHSSVDFARELVISVSRREIFVNRYKVGDITCTDASGQPCTEKTTQAEAVYSVNREKAPGERQRYLILPLLQQLEYFQKGRKALLRRLDDKAPLWLLTCDAVTVAADRDLPYGVLAQVLHTAAAADLSRVRLVVVDDSETLAYIPLLSPRESKRIASRTLISQGTSPAAEASVWPVRWLGVSASSFPEDFVARGEPRLPACLPDMDYAAILAGGAALKNAHEVWSNHVAGVMERYGVELGLLEPNEAINEAVGVEPEGDTLPADAGAVDPGGASDVVAQPELTEEALATKKAADEAEAKRRARTEAEPYLFVSPGEYLLVFRSSGGEVVEALRVERSKSGEILAALEASQGKVLGLGAHPKVPVRDLVADLDSLRNRCELYTMSGKCKRPVPLFPWIYMFIVDGEFDEAVKRLAAPAPTKDVAPSTGDVPPGQDGTKPADAAASSSSSPASDKAAGDGHPGGGKPASKAVPPAGK